MRATGNKLTRIKSALTTFPLQNGVSIQYTKNNQTITQNEDKINNIIYYYDGDILKSNVQVLVINSVEEIEKNTIFNFEIKVKTTNGMESLPYGKFKVLEVEKQEDTNTYLMTCYDELVASMTEYTTPTGVTYPITLGNYLNAICTYLGLTLTSTTFTNSTKVIPSEKYLGLGYTFRDVLDEICEATGMSICIDATSGNVKLKKATITSDTINEDYLNENNVNIGEKYGPINSIVLSRSAESDNVYKRDETSILQNGLCELKIVDNQIMNDNNRSEYLQGIADNLFGLEYYQTDYTSSSQGIFYYEFMDLHTINRNNTNYTCLMLNDNLVIDGNVEENIYSNIPKNAKTDYSKASETDKMKIQTTLIVDKMQGEIDAKVDKDGIVAQLNLAVEDGQGIVYFKGNYFVVDADNLKIDNYGNVTAYNLKLINGNIELEDDGSQENSSIKIRVPSQYTDSLLVGDNLNGKKLLMKLKNYTFQTLDALDGTALITTSLNSQSKSLILKIEENDDGEQYLHFYVFVPNQSLLQEVVSPIKFENGLITNDFELNIPEFFPQFGTITSLTNNSIINDIVQITYEVIRENSLNGKGMIADLISDYDYTQADITRCEQIILGQVQPTDADYRRLDVNKNGTINALDLLKITKYVNSGITTSTPGKIIIDTENIERNLAILDGNGDEKVSFSLLYGIKENGAPLGYWYVTRPVVLFDYPNGSADDSNTLSDYIYNYEYIEILYINNDGIENSTKVYTQNRSNVHVCLNSCTINSSYVWVQYGDFILNDDKILRNGEKLTRISNGAVDYSENTNYTILIKKILGYKE